MLLCRRNSILRRAGEMVTQQWQESRKKLLDEFSKSIGIPWDTGVRYG